MDSTDPKAATATPRSHAERSAATRAKVIAAAIGCLNELGYEGTTVLLVAKRAAVSRGAAQHQFPAKVDLMLAVAEAIVNQQTQLRRDMWDSLVAEGDSLSKMVDFSWSLQRHPDNLALLEIMLATRNDAELRARFKPFQRYIADLRERGAARIATLIGAPADDPDMLNLMRLHYASMRGLAIDALVGADEAELQAAVDLLKDYERTLVERVYDKLNPDNNR